VSSDCSAPGDVFVVKFLGNVRGDLATFPIAGAEAAHAVATDGTDIVVVGDFDSHIDFDPATSGQLGNNGGREIFVAKLRGSDLAHVWSHSYGGSGNDIAYDVAIDSATGRVIVTGVVRDSVDLGNGEEGSLATGADVFVLALDPDDGRTLQSWRFGAEGDQEGRSVAVDSNGNMEGAIDFGQGVLTSSDGSRDVFVAKLVP
jgi:hypothetical protein